MANLTKNNLFFIGQFVAFILATIAAVVYLFLAIEMVVLIALVLYVVAFGMMSTSQLLEVEYDKRIISKLENKKSSVEEANAETTNINQTENEQTITETETNETEKTVKDSATGQVDVVDKMSEIKKRISWGYVRAGLCAALAALTFIVLVLF